MEEVFDINQGFQKKASNLLNETIKKTCGSKKLETVNGQVYTPWQAIVVIVESVRILKNF